MRIGLLGGTFNPPHLGHLVCAQEAWAQLGLDRVLLLPVHTPPHEEVVGIRASSTAWRSARPRWPATSASASRAPMRTQKTSMSHSQELPISREAENSVPCRSIQLDEYTSVWLAGHFLRQQHFRCRQRDDERRTTKHPGETLESILGQRNRLLLCLAARG